MAQIESCGRCGRPAQGRFCSQCGAPLDVKGSPAVAVSDVNEGWKVAIADVVTGERDGVLSVAMSFARTPVDTILRLAADPGYTGHWRFLIASLGAALTLVFVLMPQFAGAVFHVPVPNRKAETLVVQAVQLAALPILTPIQFYLCRAIGSIGQTPRAYLKLCALSVGFGWMLFIAASLVEAAILLALVATDVPFDPKMADIAQSVALALATVAFVVATHRRFWGMNWLRAILVTVAIAILSWGVVYPALFAIVGQLDVINRLKAMTG